MPRCVRSAVTLGRAKALLTRWLQCEERFLVAGVGLLGGELSCTVASASSAAARKLPVRS
jgi:hypothetical protein